jgi:peptide/nickel transport system substrate-binding protein
MGIRQPTGWMIACATLAVAATLAFALSACGSSGSSPSGSSSSQAPQRGGTLVVARGVDILTLDVTRMTQNEDIWTSKSIFDTLYTSSRDGKSLVPSLATSYSVSKDHLTWTFNLRKGVKFQSGKDLTSADVMFSLEQVRSDPTSPFNFMDAVFTSITAPSPYTVVIKTKVPWAPLVADLALYANSIYPANYGGESKTAFWQHPVGTGPFEFKSWQKGVRVVLVRNPTYWQTGKPYLDSLVFTNVPDNNTRALQLQGGQAQIDAFPAFSSISQLQTTSGLKVSEFNSSRTDFLEFNEKRTPFQDVHVRRAISYALDRKAMVQAVLFGHGMPANSILSHALWGYDPNCPGLQYDVAKAKQEMAASSVPKGFRTTLMVGSGVTSEQSLAQIVQEELKPLGIQVTLQQVDANSEYTNIQKFDYDMAFNYCTTDIVDPDEMVAYEVMGGNTGQGTHAQWTNYDNAQVDAWAQEAERTFNPAQRLALYSKIQLQAAKDAVDGYLYYSPFVYALSAKVHGFQVYPTGDYHFENVWLSK